MTLMRGRDPFSPDPLPDAVPVTGHWSFLGEGVETEVDGKPPPTGG